MKTIFIVEDGPDATCINDYWCFSTEQEAIGFAQGLLLGRKAIVDEIANRDELLLGIPVKYSYWTNGAQVQSAVRIISKIVDWP